jgi:hypothetical protein
MTTKLVEIGAADLAATAGVQPFTEAGDRNWAAVVALAPGDRAGSRPWCLRARSGSAT